MATKPARFERVLLFCLLVLVLTAITGDRTGGRDLGTVPHRMSCPAGREALGPSVSPAISTITPSHVGGGHIPDTAYTARGADVQILQ